MDTGFAQVISSALGAMASIIGAIIVGYYTVKASQAKVGEKEATPQPQPVKRRFSWPVWASALICGLASMPVAFTIAYTGNSLSGGYDSPFYSAFADSIDPALVSGILGFFGFLLGAWVSGMGLSTGKIIMLVLIVAVFSSPVAYSLAYTGNWYSGVPQEFLFSDSFDSLLVGGLMCAISFVIGTLVGQRSQKHDPSYQSV